MEIKDKLSRSLEMLRLPDSTIRVIDGDGGKVIAMIVSSAFEGMSEADRQRVVWEHVLSSLSPAEQALVEFLFTDAPSEVPV